MYLLYLVTIVYVFKYCCSSVNPGWCERYSRNSSLLKEDVTVIENSERRFPNCQWQVHLQNVTRLFLELQISQMPFSNIYEYGLFQGQIAKTNFDAVRILSGSCINGRVLLSLSGTTQITSKLVRTDTVCFQHISNSDIYYENRLQFRVRLKATEVECRRDQMEKNESDSCSTVCLPNNKTKKECFEPVTNYSIKSNSGNTKNSLEENNTTTTVSVRKVSKNENTQHRNKGLITDNHITTRYRPSSSRLSTKALLLTPKRNLLQTSTNPPITDQVPKSIYISTTLRTTQYNSVDRDCSQMTVQDIYTGLYIASTIAGVLTIIVIVLIVSCVRNNREVKKLTEIMVRLSRSKAKPEHTRVHRQEFSGWSSSSSTSSLHPPLPPRPDYLPSLSNSTAETEISHYNHSDEELYDNIGIMTKHRYKGGFNRNEPTYNSSNEEVRCNQHFMLTSLLNKSVHSINAAMKDQEIGNIVQNVKRCGSISSKSSSGEYIDSNSVQSNTYRKVNKSRL